MSRHADTNRSAPVDRLIRALGDVHRANLGEPYPDLSTETHEAAEALTTAIGLLHDALDLVPRVSDDDPMVPALREWCASVRAALPTA